MSILVVFHSVLTSYRNGQKEPFMLLPSVEPEEEEDCVVWGGGRGGGGRGWTRGQWVVGMDGCRPRRRSIPRRYFWLSDSVTMWPSGWRVYSPEVQEVTTWRFFHVVRAPCEKTKLLYRVSSMSLCIYRTPRHSSVPSRVDACFVKCPYLEVSSLSGGECDYRERKPEYFVNIVEVNIMI